ncbi:PEGA domain-containing protein [Sessilibacter corallicola]|uniref:PEGA domain-containing protein n=1 Tax=Sessilibacter corallicola TaxID=2904075 RepID=A0ABQ0A6I3_9GAMM
MEQQKPIKRLQAAEFTPTVTAVQKNKSPIKPVHIFLLALFLVIAGIGWYLVTARSLIVYPNPPESDVYLSGGFHLKIGESFLLLPGQYTLEASHDEFYTYTSEFTVTDEDNQTTEIQLTPLPGDIRLVLNPEVEAEVFIDGNEVTVVDGLIADIAAGNHTYSITTQRYQPTSGEINVEGRKKEQNLELTLEPAWADVKLDSLPTGAEIYLNEQLIGTTPSTVEILEGDQTLDLRLTGYKHKQYPFSVVAQKPQNLGTLVLEKIDGLIKLTSSPSGASVTIDGQYVGQTPISAPVNPAEKLSVRLFKDGYKSVSRSVSIKSGDEIDLNVSLPVLLGEVKIKSQPEDALLYVDGRLSGRANQSLQLPAKQHRIVIKKEGYVDFTTSVIPRPGLAQNLNPRLKTLEEAKWESVKLEYQNVTGQTLKLFRPQDTFTMGASRREQGRRSNEAMKKVQLTRPFYLATHETTNEQFKRYKSSHSSSHVSGNSLDNGTRPVVNVSWTDAALFCNWLSEQENLPPFYEFEEGKLVSFNPQSNGYRLPTEAEWSWAARFKDGNMLRYPWGNALPPPAKVANIGDRSAASILGVIQASYDDGYIVTAPVGQFPANHLGLYDLGGNAAEWVHDYYLITTGVRAKSEVDPLGPSEGDYHVIRGASWSSGGITDLRLSYRDYGNDPKRTIGFRIARFLE